MQNTYKLFLFLIALSFGALTSCNLKPNEPIQIEETQYSIAITKAHGSSGYEQYKIWISGLDSSIIIYDLYELSLDSASNIMEIVDGLIISGGPDVNPSLYGFDSLAWMCQTPDNYRDSLELQSIDYAYKHQLPILGICRGQQILNVYFGGTLITDIPSQNPSDISHRNDTSKSHHSILFVENSPLIHLAQNDTAWVNSSHHQAVKDLGLGLEVYAYSSDSTIESIGLEDTTYNSFFLGVQFHPEHMLSSEFANSIGYNFIESIK